MRAAEPVGVAALEWLDPVFTAGHWTPQLIEYAGGVDLLGLPGEHSEQRTWDEVRAAQPEVVIVMPCGYDAERALEEAETYADELESLGARRIVAVDAAAHFSRPGPRLIEGLEVLAHILHPDRLPQAPAPARARSARAELRRSRCRPRRARRRRDEPDRDAGQDRQEVASALARELLDRQAQSAPPTRPPRWPPIEMLKPGRKVMARLIRINGPIPERHGSTPRARCIDEGGGHEAEDGSRGADGDRVGAQRAARRTTRRAATRSRARGTRTLPSTGSSIVPSQ